MAETNVVKLKNGAEIRWNDHRICFEVRLPHVVRCVCTKQEKPAEPSLLICRTETGLPEFDLEETAEDVSITTEKIIVRFHKASGRIEYASRKTGRIFVTDARRSLVEEDVIKYRVSGGRPLVKRVKTVDGERSFVDNLERCADRKAYRAKVCFQWVQEEGIYGLGQGEEGIYNYRGHSQYLYQHNMRIPVPFFVSANHYGILFDCCSLMTFQDESDEPYVFMDTVKQIDYYFIGGEDLDDVIEGYRYLTGKAVMLPKWAFGYIQSKEAYRTDRELADTAKRYRELGIPLDVIVQDWNTWEPGKWGDKNVDKTRYGNLKECLDEIHKMNVHTMVSIWPNMNAGGEDHREFEEHGWLLNDYSTYDAFDPDARRMYWKQAEKELFSSGFDSWWCDSTEPFSGPDWSGEEKREPWERYILVGGEHKKYLDPEYANVYSVVHAQGIYENQRMAAEGKRVLNLTRSGYASSQRYGTVLWSGDISATWRTLKKQITEGLNFSMSGMPYWTLDIGGFFVVGSAWQKRGCGNQDNPDPLWFWKGDYNDGVEDPAYRELYVRWLEYGTFLPVFRSHGTDTPREIWNFGKKGEIYYDIIERYIKLRYHLMPYIYSLAGNVWRKDGTIMRSLLFDFADDKNVWEIKDQFLFGPAFLVCPVTEPGAEKRSCYLPQGAQWTDYWTGEVCEGGQWVCADAPLETIPLYVRAGSIIPVTEGLQYAMQPAESPLMIRIWGGADGEFELYEDEGEGYAYENGMYSIIRFVWDDAGKSLAIEERRGGYPGMEEIRDLEIIYSGIKKRITYAGRYMKIDFAQAG